ncbi:MAG: glycoside hydrolase family 9 protein [Acidobacteriaceae bacterium]|nr:glycoside hydrolase family 9 protein [Acidobacteriaceae bacterium]
MSRSQTLTLAALLAFPLSQTGYAAKIEKAYVRVSQVGYEAGNTPFRAFLMSTVAETGATFRVVNSNGQTAYSGAIGRLTGTWSNSALTYKVYALDFSVPGGNTYSIAVSGPVAATSPKFAVDTAAALYSGLLLNTRFFYETERDGKEYVANALRTAPGHLNDAHAKVYLTPPLDDNDLINTTGTPLTPTGKIIDASGGWWDAGDYMKYVETMSYTVALQEIGIRDFPDQLGPRAPINPPPPPVAISYAGNAAGAPASSNLTNEAAFGIDFLMKMWDDDTRTLYYQVANSQDWANFPVFLSDYDIWRLPQADDNWNGCDTSATYICHRPVFVSGPAGSKISPNLAGRLAADFAVCYVLNRISNPQLARQCLKNAADIFELADTSLADPAASVGSGTCPSGCLLTIIPFDGYPETVWEDDMELGAAELYFALRTAQSDEGALALLRHADPTYYLKQAAQYAQNYITNIYATGNSDSLNLYDVSGLAHFELYRALQTAGDPKDLPLSRDRIRAQLLKQVNDAIAAANGDAWGFGAAWNTDTASHGAGVSVMASEAQYLDRHGNYAVYARRWMANVLGANPWGSSFIVGDGSKTFPNCIQHQVANLAGALDGTAAGTPVLWGAVSEGPASAATSGVVSGMILCPANGSDPFEVFDGNNGAYNPSEQAVYQDNVQSYTTTEPAIDLTATSFLMWSWRLAGQPSQ